MKTKIKINLNKFNLDFVSDTPTVKFLKRLIPKRYLDNDGGFYSYPDTMFIKATLYEPRRDVKIQQHIIGTNNLLALGSVIVRSLKQVAYDQLSQVAEIRVSRQLGDYKSLELEVIPLWK